MAFTHPVIAIPLTATFYRRDVPVSVWLWGAFLTALPDIDFLFGVPYSHMMGHRGFTHSIFFAAMAALLSAACFFWRRHFPKFWTLALFFFLCTVSHGILDGMTDGGLGVAYFAPFENSRYWMPWRPIPVAPLGIRHIFGAWGARVVASEVVWIWIPTLLLTALIVRLRRNGLRKKFARDAAD